MSYFAVLSKYRLECVQLVLKNANAQDKLIPELLSTLLYPCSLNISSVAYFMKPLNTLPKSFLV